MKSYWVNIYTHPSVEGFFEGKPHWTEAGADAALRVELNDEPQTRCVRQDERLTAFDEGHRK